MYRTILELAKQFGKQDAGGGVIESRRNATIALVQTDLMTRLPAKKKSSAP